ncbi:MAG: RluA family pseudouridine synthase [Planctomycetota bacterium]|jgi:23S rRNA pseudouridine1911/1915/1917 synthase
MSSEVPGAFQPGDMSSTRPLHEAAAMLPVEDWLLLEDGPLLAFNKPAGLLTEGVPAGQATLVGAVKEWLRIRFQKSGNVYLGIPHRLDRPTSGVIVFTRNSKSAARMAEQFERRQVSKIYWALLDHAPEAESGLLVDWLRKVPDEARSETCAPDADRAKEARLEYRILGTFGGRCLVEVQLLTGRMHQIRVQFASRGCPVAGDLKYGGRPWPEQLTRDVTADNAAASESVAVTDEAIALHARSLTLKHPIRYDELTIEAPLPVYWNLDAAQVQTAASGSRTRV